MNSSYEDGQDRDAYSEPKTVRPEGGYIRQSARKHRVKSSHLVGFLVSKVAVYFISLTFEKSSIISGILQIAL